MLIKLFLIVLVVQLIAAYERVVKLDQEPINKVRLGAKFKVECYANVTNEFTFDRLIFNRSLSLSSESNKRFMKINSYIEYNKIFYLIDKQWNKNQVWIDKAKFSNSGLYYCVYSAKKIDHIEYLVESYIFLVYDDVTIIKNFRETVELDSCVDNDEKSSKDLPFIQWYYNVESSDINSQLKLNSQTYGLIISLNDLSLFDIVFRCHNSLSGAFKTYKLECSNCPIFQPPVISPTRQEVGENSDTQFTCEKPSGSDEPDRYQWFKHNSELLPQNSETIYYNFSKSVGFGSILELKDITPENAGWYICCLVKSKLSVHDKRKALQENFVDDKNPKFSCSSVELKVLPAIKKSNVWLYLLISISALAIMIMTILTLLCGRRLRSIKHAEQARDHMQKNEFYLTEEDFKNFQEKYHSSSSIEALLEEEVVQKWKIPLDCLKLDKEVGRGAFGIVIHGFLNSEKPRQDVDSGYDYSSCTSDGKSSKSIDVAIKKLPEHATEYNYYEMFKELQLMLSVGQHPHIVNLIGYCIEDQSLNIVLEYAKFGNLKDFLRNDYFGEKKIESDLLFLYAYQSALGMAYLHSKNILHRDLAARNILVDDYNSVKIADFGLARNIKSNYYYVQNLNGKVPFKWMSPESLSFEKVSKESDIWSYGVLLWEIFSYGCTPYPSIEQEEIFEKLKSGYRMERPDACKAEIYDQIIKQCWNLEQKNRPQFSEIVKVFGEFLETPEYQSVNAHIENKRKDGQANDEKYFEILSKSRASECSDCPKNTRLHPSNYWLSTSTSSFNPSNLTHTTSSSLSTSHSDVNKQVPNLYNLKTNEIEVEIEQPLLARDLPSQENKFKIPYLAENTRENPIYGGKIIHLDEEKFNQSKDIICVQNKLSNSNWKNLIKLLTKSTNKPIITDV